MTREEAFVTAFRKLHSCTLTPSHPYCNYADCAIHTRWLAFRQALPATQHTEEAR